MIPRSLASRLASAASESAALLAGTPWALIVTLAGVTAAVLVLVREGWLPRAALGVAGETAAHGALLATAVAWAAHGRRSADGPRPAAAVVVIGVGALAAAIHDLGAVAHLLAPAWLGVWSRRGRLTAIGLGTPVPPLGIALGCFAGAFLGTHLLVSASLTFGYRPGAGQLASVLAAIARDVGAQALAAECFLRGALFNRAQRRWSLAAGLAVSTAASVVRYLLDPLLPGNVEMVAGMVFYVTALSVTSAWLFWRFGTLWPGLITTCAFFAAYRVLMAR